MSRFDWLFLLFKPSDWLILNVIPNPLPHQIKTKILSVWNNVIPNSLPQNATPNPTPQCMLNVCYLKYRELDFDILDLTTSYVVC